MASKPKKALVPKAKPVSKAKAKSKGSKQTAEENDNEFIPTEPEDMKDYISLRWDITEKMKLISYHFPDGNEESPPQVQPIPGVIKHAEYAKATMVLDDPDDPNAKRKQSQVFSEERHVRKKINKK